MRLVHLTVTLGLVLLAWPPARVTGAPAKPSTWDRKLTFSPASEDAAACEKQLNNVYNALRKYYEKHGEFPERLSALLGEFIHESDELVCPYVRKSGDLSGWRQKVDQSVFDDPGSCYAYEFARKQYRFIPTMTVGEVKRQHMKLFGFGLPIVRCLAHRPVLNLGYGGAIYASNFEWEDAYLTCRDQRRLFHSLLSDTNFVMSTLVQAVNPPRPYVDVSDRQLDLTKYYNAPLFHLCRLDRRGQLLATHPLILEFMAGVLFDVRGLIHLGGNEFPITFPLESGEIPVGTNCHRLHFLHGLAQAPHASQGTPASGATIAVYTIRFADAPSEHFPIVYGKGVKVLWFRSREPVQAGEAKPAWVCQVPGTPDASRLYVKTWDNPHPERLIAGVSIRSEATNCAPFLIAITRE